jgi:hypothetical protein
MIPLFFLCFLLLGAWRSLPEITGTHVCAAGGIQRSVTHHQQDIIAITETIPKILVPKPQEDATIERNGPGIFVPLET